MTLEEINSKKEELRNELNSEDLTAERFEEIKEEVKQILDEQPEAEEPAKEEAPAEEPGEISEDEERSLIRDAQNIETRNVKIVKAIENKEERKMEKEVELRNSKEYVDAYAEYIKTGEDKELRALYTENIKDGTIAVPDIVYDFVKTAWDKEEIMSLVRKTELKGNIKINFEISGSDAVVHTEGGEAVPEEELVEGIVTIVPAFIKKWISVSDEVLGLRGEAFLNYIYDELTHKIAKKAADQLVGIIASLPQTATATSPAADKITVAPAADTVAQAFGHLSDEAANPVIIMNKLTYAEFKAVQYANNYGVDVFEGLQVKFNNTLPAYSTANAGQVYMIVGDLGEGTDANFPNGIGNIEFTFDALTKKKEDLVEILGKEYVGLGVITNKAFTLVAKPGSI